MSKSNESSLRATTDTPKYGTSSSVSSSTLSSGCVYSLSLRIERPIQGCEIQPYPFLCLKGGAMDNATRAKLMDQNPHYFTYRWCRGPKRNMCASINCPRGM
jgi:hypothetical protein